MGVLYCISMSCSDPAEVCRGKVLLHCFLQGLKAGLTEGTGHNSKHTQNPSSYNQDAIIHVFFLIDKKRHLNQILYLKRFLFLSFDFLNYKMAKIHLGNYSFWVWFFTLNSKNNNKIITFLYLVVVSIELYPNCQN